MIPCTDKRRMFFEALCRRAGIKEGDMLPWHLRALLLTLYPSRIRLALAASVYDVMTDTIKTHNARWSLGTLDRLAKPSLPGHWFRVVGKDKSGVVLLEWREDSPVCGRLHLLCQAKGDRK